MDSGQWPCAFICIVDRKFLIEMYSRQHFLLFGQFFVQRPQYVTLSSTLWSQSTIWCKIFVWTILNKNQAGTVLIGPQPWKHRVNLFDSFPIIVTNRRRGFSGCLARKFWMYTLNERCFGCMWMKDISKFWGTSSPYLSWLVCQFYFHLRAPGTHPEKDLSLVLVGEIAWTQWKRKDKNCDLSKETPGS